MNKLIILYAISSLLLFKLFECFEHCSNLSVKYEDESLKEFDAFSKFKGDIPNDVINIDNIPSYM